MNVQNNESITRLEAMLSTFGFKYYDYVISQKDLSIQFTKRGNEKLSKIYNRDLRVDILTSGFKIIEGIRETISIPSISSYK